ncbi:MAG TPA: DUF3658 domain-containing protein [Flavitalea sp.]|nr:DUF3658 domain-containing protein [Flavitalea sp.]
MIHIVFQQADIEALQRSFDLDPSMSGEIVHIKDDFAVGPLENIYTDAGIETRKQWWREVLQGGDYEGLVDKGDIDDVKSVTYLKQMLHEKESEVCWIWAAQNKHDVSGYYWLISQLKDLHGRIFILYLNNLPFINEKGNIFYPVNLFQIPPREFVKAKKLARPVTLSEFEVDSDEWTKLCMERKGVRLLEGGKKLVQVDYDFYDQELTRFINVDWQKAGRIIHQFIQKATHTTADAFLLWRLKSLLATGNFEIQGNPKGMKDFEVKLKSGQSETVFVE